ncbi:MBL fold metallo-hydrolase [Actinomadura parmotrematis]|uniref:MBL fold metallo-hydrolase n=1 Tax=Actinomadura parmotrematis TaxID=2864039 RepID=A0ABS7G148_9ACTN|nr:MBL fold metallo-hydrolase [Actinomadura parmotrematis]MBW8485562.1 MBL fold metallo-hydrolase [Actinomadura parmotrematis]
MGAAHRCAGCGEGPAPYRAELAEDRAEAACAAALDLIEAADLRKVLRQAPPKIQRHLLSYLHLRDSKKVTDRIAEQLLRAVRGGDPRRRAALDEMLASPVRHALSNAEGRTAADCAALLEGRAPDVPAGQVSWLLHPSFWDQPLPIVRWRLARGLRDSLPLSALALGLLVADADVLGDAGQALREAWTALRADHPELPRDPAGIEQALAGPLDAVVVTHAHLDHCGYVPALVARRPGLRVIATPETVRLMPVMWADSVKVMRGRDRDRTRWGLAEAGALYDHADLEDAARSCEELRFGAARRIGELTVELFPAGHILGAAGVVVHAGGDRAVITGDISGFRQESVDGYALPDAARGAGLLVMESTCCTEEHRGRDARVGDLVRAAREVCDGGGRVLVPAFALGRAQEIALILRRHLPGVPVRIDGMARELSELFEASTAGTDHPLEIFGGGVAPANRPADLDSFRRSVVITTSGMLTGGPAVQWARRILPDPGSALFVSGYQDEESPGRALLRLAGEGGGAFTLPDHGGDVTVPVRARVETMRLSGHADRAALLDIADEVAAREIMLVHGLRGRQRRFGEVLEMRGHDVRATGAWRAG